MKYIEGIGASAGIAIGQAYVIDTQTIDVQPSTIENVESEMARFEQARVRASDELQALCTQVEQSIHKDAAEMLHAQILLLQDETFLTPIHEKIQQEKWNAGYAVKKTTDHFIAVFEALEDAYIKERALDLLDVTERLLTHLELAKHHEIVQEFEHTIVVSHDLTPSYTAQLDCTHVQGLITCKGAKTSHTSIIAKSMQLPALVGVKDALLHIQHGDLLIIDGEAEKILVNPSPTQLQAYQEKQSTLRKQQQFHEALRTKNAMTVDGFEVQLHSNIESAADIPQVKAAGSDGIGLFRTEFLLLEKAAYQEEALQFEAYRSVVKQMPCQEVTIRSFDVGGDKLYEEQDAKELNPFLGYRAIRVSLHEDQLFRRQVRAILRASAFGRVRLMFPMITTLTELRQAKAIVAEEKAYLLQKSVAVAQNMPIGMVIETPASALLARQFAKEVDFFSIGTNDLIQYTMAADRLNERVSYLYEPYHPAVLQLIEMVVHAAEAEGIEVSVCGEMASDQLAIPLLLGLGIRSLSMNSRSILQAKAQIRNCTMQECQKIARLALEKGTANEVIQLVQSNKRKDTKNT